MRNLKLLILAILLFASNFLNAQDFPYQYFSAFNPMVNNPSLAAYNSEMSVDIASYNLWAAGFKPLNDYMVSFSATPTFKKRNRKSNYDTRVGLAATFLSEKVGPFNLNILQLVYAYHIPIDKSTFLSLGICGIMENIQVDVNSLSPLYSGDPRLLSGNNNSVLIDGGFGASIHSQKFLLSFSAINLAPGVFRFKNNSGEDISTYRKFFLSGNYRFEIRQNICFKPGLTIRNSRLNNVDADILGSFDFTYFSCGLGYRSENSIFVFTQIPYKNFIFSYSSENPFNSTHFVGNGHTFSLGWKIPR